VQRDHLDGSSPLSSMRWMMRTMRLTLLARIGDDQHIAGGIGGQLPVLGDERPQNRHQLRCTDIFY